LKEYKRSIQEDKEENVITVTCDGYDEGALIVARYDPNCMARCIEETFRLISSAEQEPDDHSYALWPNLSRGDLALYMEPTEESQVQEKKARPVKFSSKAAKKTEHQFLTIDSSDDSSAFYQAASTFIAESMPQAIEKFYLNFIDEVMKHALNAVAEDRKQRGLKKPSKAELISAHNRWTQAKRIQLGLPPQNRPRGSGAFRSREDFLTALAEVLSKPLPNPTRGKLWKRLKGHRLYRGKRKDEPAKDEGQTLDDWFRRSGIKNIEEAIKRFGKEAPNGE
jgi:hypothetical protein